MQALPSGSSSMVARAAGSGPADTVDLADVARTVRRGWAAVLAFLGLGVVGGILVIAFAPRKFDGRAAVIVRSSEGGGSSLISRLTGAGDLLSGSLGGATQIETEIELLKSRALAGEVVDSLRLQAVVRSPGGVPPMSLLASIDLPGSFAPAVYEFRRDGSGAYRAVSERAVYELSPGKPARFDGGFLTIREDAPDAFELLILDREDAISRLHRSLEVSKSGSEIARISYRGDDSLTAAQVPNTLVGFYLDQRKSVDRGTNAKRVEFLTRQVDSTAAELATAARALRRYQETTGVLDAELLGRVEIERGAVLRKALAEVEVDERALRQLLGQSAEGTLTRRQIAAYPAFLRGSALAPLVGQISELEAQRLQLLERRTEADPEVVALDRSIQAIENQFLTLAQSYVASLGRQRAELTRQIDSLQQAVLALPAAAEAGGRLQRDVIRLSEIYGAMEAQLVEARLAAIGEGGDVRLMDAAVPPRRPAFPKPLITMGVGITGGLVAGVIAAILLGVFGRWFRDPSEIERAVGIAAQRLTPGTPLVVAGNPSARTVLVIPTEPHVKAGVVAQQLARTATHRSVSATVLDLSTARSNGNGVGAPDEQAGDVGALIERMEQEHDLVVVQLRDLSDEATLAVLRDTRPVLLVAPAGRVHRARLENTLETLRRLNVPCAGIVLSDGTTRLAAAR